MGKLLLAIFQVKYKYYEAANLKLIKLAVAKLHNRATCGWSKLQISLNFPGIGNGRLDRDRVLPLLQRLPDNVTVWEL